MNLSRKTARRVLPFAAAGILAMLGGSPSIVASAGAPAREPRVIWDKMCASCHGADGRGNPDKAKVLKIDPVLLNLGRPGAEKITAEERKTILLTGKEKMPGYEKKLAAEEVDPLLKLCEELAAAARETK